MSEQSNLMTAHIRKENNTEQTVCEHCRNVSELCEKYASCLTAEHIGALQGLLHDAGKMTDIFQDYLYERIKKRRGEIDHSFSGAKYLCRLASCMDERKYYPVSRLIAHTILSHHGIHDWIDSGFQDCFHERLKKNDDYEEVCKNMNQIAEDKELQNLLKFAENEYQELDTKIRILCQGNKEIYAFYMGMLERFFQSVLIDADRTDTANFMTNSQTEKIFDTETLWKKMSDKMQEKYLEFSKKTDKISVQRCSISGRCVEFAKHPVEICRLIVPTGGGKTLSSLRFAIKHCQKYHKKKILYIAPFMSILEQNSDEIKAIVGEDFFTEHHSNLLAELKNDEEYHEYELRTEKWDAPVIATTMVQFLNTLFSFKNSSVRRMHRLADAVIIIDEVQSIPLKCVHLFNLAVNFLTHICGSAVVLCSATQPVMEQTKYPLLIDSESSMTGNVTEDFEIFHRTELFSEVAAHGYSYKEAAGFCKEKFLEQGNLLVIVNTKSAAGNLFRLLKENLPEVPVIYLSTNLCPVHRNDKIREMKEFLNQEKPVICVTTQLIEAGVDISFRCVVRSMAGLDNAAQAAGRCNRNGESEMPCPVYLIKLKEEQVKRLDGIQLAQTVTQQILDNPQYTNYLSHEIQSLYFEALYQRAGNGKLSYPVSTDGQNTTLIELLSLNKERYQQAKMPKIEKFTCQAFKTAGSLFEVIDAHTQDVIVPYNDDAKKIIEELDREISPERCRELLRKAQRYTVGIYKDKSKKLYENHALRPLLCGAEALESGFYDAECGMITENAEHELLIF